MEKELKSCTGILLRADLTGHNHPIYFGRFNLITFTKSLLTSPSNVLPYYLKETFPPIITIFLNLFYFNTTYNVPIISLYKYQQCYASSKMTSTQCTRVKNCYKGKKSLKGVGYVTFFFGPVVYVTFQVGQFSNLQFGQMMNC